MVQEMERGPKLGMGLSNLSERILRSAISELSTVAEKPDWRMRGFWEVLAAAKKRVVRPSRALASSTTLETRMVEAWGFLPAREGEEKVTKSVPSGARTSVTRLRPTYIWTRPR